MQQKRILVAVLNWGLGHATRCIPIIHRLQKEGFEVFLASDGAALALLQKEFPDIKSFQLPAYNISYSKSSRFLTWKLISQSLRILKTIRKERKYVEKLAQEYQFNGIVSDNRWGCRHPKTKSVFITHQLNVLSGSFTRFSSKLHQKYIAKFDECWVPDAAGNQNLSGFMGHLKNPPKNIKYIGPLSRFNKSDFPKKYDYTIILSGPEPQRTLLEEKLLDIFLNSNKKIVFIRGIMDEKKIFSDNKNLIIKNYLTSKALEKLILSSETIICRSGYSSIMDLAKLEKKAFFIPTPGQYEQEYLAERLHKLGIAPYCKQEHFDLSKLTSLRKFSGFQNLNFPVDFSQLFTIFEAK